MYLVRFNERNIVNLVKLVGIQHSVAKDHLKQKSVTISQWLEVIEVLQGPTGEPARVDPTHFIHHRLLTRAARWNQVAIVRYFQDDLKRPVTPTAVRWTLAAQSYDVLDFFISRGWDINHPLLDNQAPILWCVD